MLDLEVQSAHPRRDYRSAADVAGGECLAAEEVDREVLWQDRHPLVIGREAAPHVDAEQRDLYDHERQPHQRSRGDHDKRGESDQPHG